ncbi:alpha-glucuronidase family glycosyl hydrolase [Flavobacterium aquicola]|uniref:Xylan alpha-1,2-glucuronidase n=1 Tax=Flavobacterium aquicola TaxID=1682742 RepID=A0A3E0EN68_9FLAO|nr:alpha-glucuronidase family glycosyl hydrolase [Flavobacterium aquicola]REG99628.1 alpha-glucuronidase [Flavobacterium aquicola]
MKHNKMSILRLMILLLGISWSGFSQKDYKLWLQYNTLTNLDLKAKYLSHIKGITLLGNSETISIAGNELQSALEDMLEKKITVNTKLEVFQSIVIGSKTHLNAEIQKTVESDLNLINDEGFIIKSIVINNKSHIVITGKKEVGVLYGVYSFLRLIQTNKSIEKLNIADSPKTNIRILNHWDNLDRTVERGYAGFSLWNWQKLPDFIEQRYIDYARANASIGINGTVLTNVNANALILTPQYLEKVEALANVFRPYGIKVYLTARFSAPIEIGGLKTADPKDADVANWWKAKAKEIYVRIPDFGGFLVKANSEGQPGPQNYGRNHVDGANMLADAVAPFGGVIMWRAFVYSEHDANDRAKQAHAEFQPCDGKFRENVIVQVKNGAIDFQPREPFHPLFGAMTKTPLMMEFQITQEYLGFSTHLVFLPKLFQEVLESDTYQKGKGSTVTKVIDGSIYKNKITGIAGVANIGNDLNWTGHPFAQANWYGFGRLAWNPYLDSETIADEWLRCTFSNDKKFIAPIKEMLIQSREAVVNYMTPLGLHHIMDTGHHYGPGPWVSNLSRPEWNPVYYHKADKNGIGFDRSKSGTNAVSQYAPEVAVIFDKLETCPEKDLLWFHHVSWDYKLKDGHTLWDGMALKYQQGVNQVAAMQKTWNASEKYVDSERFKEVQMLLNIQYKEAKWWRDACLLYFQQFSGKELPIGVEKPSQSLEYFESLKFPFAPGN